MVKSLINPSVSYGESVAIGQDDKGYEGAIFEADYEGLDLKIVAGRGALAEDDLDVVFYPAYLVVKGDVMQKIGYLEGSAMGDDPEIDSDQYLDKLTDLRLNMFVSKQRLEELIRYETELTANRPSAKGVSTKKDSGQTDIPGPVSSVDDSPPSAKTATLVVAPPKPASTPKRASTPKKSESWLDEYLDTTGFTDVECGAQGDCFFFSLFTALASDPSRFESYKSDPGVRGELFQDLDLAKWNGMVATKKRAAIRKAREAIAKCYPLQSLETGSALYRDALKLSKALPSQIKTKKSEVSKAAAASEKAEKKLRLLEGTKPKDADKRATEVKALQTEVKALQTIMEQGRSELGSLNEQKIQAQLDMFERKHFKQIDASQVPATRRTQFTKNIVATNKVGAYRWSEVDETMIATVEDLLNVKCIILSEPSTVKCGLAIDRDARDDGCPELGIDQEGDNVGPKGYVLLNFKEGEDDTPNHYKLFARRGPGNQEQSLFEFEDLPKTLVSAIVDSCMIGPSGTITESVYSSIPAFYNAAAGVEETQADLVTNRSSSTQ